YDSISPEEKASIENDIPIFKAPDPQTSEGITVLEQFVGTLPLSLKSWYEEVGYVNLIGLFSPSDGRDFSRSYGCVLDPLFIYSLEMAIKMVTGYKEAGVWEHDPTLPLLVN
ncbi:MAG TPA: hypothetical protein VIY29_25895, partial [Ktedonobacteraceae bacterium]